MYAVCRLAFDHTLEFSKSISWYGSELDLQEFGILLTVLRMWFLWERSSELSNVFNLQAAYCNLVLSFLTLMCHLLRSITVLEKARQLTLY